MERNLITNKNQKAMAEKKVKDQTITFRILSEHIPKLTEIAEKNHRTMSGEIRFLVAEAIEKYERKNQK